MIRKVRHGARGTKKVTTGCLTCNRSRHKKCDEARPACSPCIGAGWKCDFASSAPPGAPRYTATPLICSLRCPAARPLLAGEYQHMEYFRVVCVGEFSLFFEVTEWENILVQGTLAEPALHHAALAIGALASSRYHPNVWQSTPAIVFSIRHYSMAIQDLQGRLDGSPRSVELAVLASVLFSYIEFLLDIESRVEMHIQAGCSMLENLLTRYDMTLALFSRAGSNCEVGSSSTRYHLLARAMYQVTTQIMSLRILLEQ
ncbi:C6 zinc finger protein [Fusarium oxysporum f. sp. phaseoli]